MSCRDRPHANEILQRSVLWSLCLTFLRLEASHSHLKGDGQKFTFVRSRPPTSPPPRLHSHTSLLRAGEREASKAAAYLSNSPFITVQRLYVLTARPGLFFKRVLFRFGPVNNRRGLVTTCWLPMGKKKKKDFVLIPSGHFQFISPPIDPQ